MRWPELESRLYQLFLERRERGQTIRRSWLRTNSLFLFRQLYLTGERTGLGVGRQNLLASNEEGEELGNGEGSEVFRFSHGWFS